MSKSVVLVAILALPLTAYAQSAENPNAKAASQLAAALGSSDSKPSRKPNLSDVKQAKAETSADTATTNQRGEHLAVAPTRDNSIEPIDKVNKVEAKGSRSAFQPVPDGADRMRGVRLGKPRRVQLATFDPSQLRAGTAATTQTDDIAKSWKSNLKWSAITVESYAMIKGRSEADMQKLAQRNAEHVRAYLMRRGIPGEYVLAIGHADASAASAKVELTVTTCDDVTIACRKPTPAK